VPSAESICLPGNRIEALESPSKVERIYFFTGFLNTVYALLHTWPHKPGGSSRKLESRKFTCLLFCVCGICLAATWPHAICGYMDHAALHCDIS
jgi:hypothetical protein